MAQAILMIAIISTAFGIISCSEDAKVEKGTTTLVPEIDLGVTIGSLANVSKSEPIVVEGYGLVGGLKGTGSLECPAQIKDYLTSYILTQLPEQRVEVDKFITSLDTAVVLVEGIISGDAWKGQKFDVRVIALPGTQTTSLEDGWLYRAELKPRGTFGVTIRIMADAEGPVYIDKINKSASSDKKVGYVLAGGKVLDEPSLTLALLKPDYRVASRIRNRLNERFGHNTARAVSSGVVEFKVPAKYVEHKLRFISMVEALYLDYGPEITKERINTFVRKLAVSEDKYPNEVALEAIGNQSITKLAVLLNSSNEEVRLRAARCMLNLGDDRGLQALRKITIDKDSSYRIEALDAITASAKRNDAAAISRKLLRDDNLGIRLMAYEQLRELNDISIKQDFIANSFYLEQIAQTDERAIFVSRSGQPRIVLFGAPIYCRENIFIESDDGNVIIDSRAGQKYVSIIRKHPTRPTIIGPLRSSFELSNIILTLCGEPLKKNEEDHVGLGISYATTIALLKRMCDKDFIDAEFWAGPLPNFGAFIKK